MVSDIFLAMTGAEICGCRELPSHPGYMACHFSPYGQGLSDLPDAFPEGCLLILNDRIPICGHDPKRIAQQLQETVERLQCSCLLLDLQRTGSPEAQLLCETIAKAPPCPVGISEGYARSGAAVFLPPVPRLVPLEAHLRPWEGWEIWLEVAPEYWITTVTGSGSEATPLPYQTPGQDTFPADGLHCRYFQEVYDDRVLFHFFRTPEDIDALLVAGKALGVERAIGLYQQFYAVSEL